MSDSSLILETSLNQYVWYSETLIYYGKNNDTLQKTLKL